MADELTARDGEEVGPEANEGRYLRLRRKWYESGARASDAMAALHGRLNQEDGAALIQVARLYHAYGFAEAAFDVAGNLLRPEDT